MSTAPSWPDVTHHRMAAFFISVDLPEIKYFSEAPKWVFLARFRRYRIARRNGQYARFLAGSDKPFLFLKSLMPVITKQLHFSPPMAKCLLSVVYGCSTILGDEQSTIGDEYR